MGRTQAPPEDDPWPQRLFVLARIDELLASGVPIEDLARDFGKKPSSIERSWRYNYDRMPHPNTMVKIAKRLGLPLKAVYDPMPEPPQPEKDELTLANEMLAGAMGSGPISRFTDKEKIAAYRAAIAMAERILTP